MVSSRRRRGPLGRFEAGRPASAPGSQFVQATPPGAILLLINCCCCDQKSVLVNCLTMTVHIEVLGSREGKEWGASATGSHFVLAMPPRAISCVITVTKSLALQTTFYLRFGGSMHGKGWGASRTPGSPLAPTSAGVV